MQITDQQEEAWALGFGYESVGNLDKGELKHYLGSWCSEKKLINTKVKLQGVNFQIGRLWKKTLASLDWWVRTPRGSIQEECDYRSRLNFRRDFYSWASLLAQMVKNLPAMRETWVWSLGWEGLLGEGSGHPLQYSCLENSMDRGAWQATVSRVPKSQIQLKHWHFP